MRGERQTCVGCCALRVLGVLTDALAVVEMRQNALYHGRVFEVGHDLHLAATGLAGLDKLSFLFVGRL